MDITNFIDWFIGQFLTLFSYIYSTLDSITFHGVSLLGYSLTLILMGVIITTLTTLPKREKLKTGRRLGSNDNNSREDS